MNPAGWVFIVDRKKDMINASGYKVWPREVEDVLAEHPAVLEAAVIGVPDDKRGETVKAFVSVRVGAQVTPEELIAHCKARMAAYKYPRQIEILDELPKTVTGKILRRELRGSPSGRDGTPRVPSQLPSLVNQWLMGEDPPVFDILAWNADGTNLPARLHEQFFGVFRSWWEAWSAWVRQRSGEETPAPLALGGERHPALEPAPGSYVLDRVPGRRRASNGQPVGVGARRSTAGGKR